MMAEEPRNYLVFKKSNASFYRHRCHGYCRAVYLAGRFTREAAEGHVALNHGDVVAIPMRDIIERLHEELAQFLCNAQALQKMIELAGME